jgi:hypothetical protein
MMARNSIRSQGSPGSKVEVILTIRWSLIENAYVLRPTGKKAMNSPVSQSSSAAPIAPDIVPLEHLSESNPPNSPLLENSSISLAGMPTHNALSGTHLTLSAVGPRIGSARIPSRNKAPLRNALTPTIGIAHFI